MYIYQNRIIIFLATLLFCVLNVASVQAQYTPPENVTIEMYRLIQGTGASTDIPCRPGDISYGCTAYPSDPSRAYPFEDSTVTISIDGDAIVDPDNDGNLVEDNLYTPSQRYLWDLVPAEYGIHEGSRGNKEFSGVEAQAIASRTYAYQRIQDKESYDPYNNSTQFHVYIPYSYQALLTQSTQQERLLDAMRHRLYMSPPDNDYPITALYGADNGLTTVSSIAEGKGEITQGNGYSPRQSVIDPINEEYGRPFGTTYGGMSSKGASRWSFGHTSSKGPSPPHLPTYPGDLDGEGDFWSVRLDHSRQILTHYYTGIHIRNADSNNEIMTPNYRWVPLGIVWKTDDGIMPAKLCLDTQLKFTVIVQNTGTEPWIAEEGLVGLTYQSYRIIQPAQVGPLATHTDNFSKPLFDVHPGNIYAAPVEYEVISVGSDKLRLVVEMAKKSSPTAESEKFSVLQSPLLWPAYDIGEFTVIDCDNTLHLPLVPSNN